MIAPIVYYWKVSPKIINDYKTEIEKLTQELKNKENNLDDLQKEYRLFGRIKIVDRESNEDVNFNCSSIQIYKLFPPAKEAKADGYFPNDLVVHKIGNTFPDLTLTSEDRGLSTITIPLQVSISKSEELRSRDDLGVNDRILAMENQGLYYITIDATTINIESSIIMYKNDSN